MHCWPRSWHPEAPAAAAHTKLVAPPRWPASRPEDAAGREAEDGRCGRGRFGALAAREDPTGQKWEGGGWAPTEGPLAGVRPGTRPLTAGEVVENWDEVLGPRCFARWRSEDKAFQLSDIDDAVAAAARRMDFFLRRCCASGSTAFCGWPSAKALSINFFTAYVALRRACFLDFALDLFLASFVDLPPWPWDLRFLALVLVPS